MDIMGTLVSNHAFNIHHMAHNRILACNTHAAQNLDALLGPFTNNLGVALAPGARFAWITPRPQSTDPWLLSSGFERQERHPLDMGGFVAELQRWRKAR